MSTIDKQRSGSYLMPALEHATVADAMSLGVMTCDPQTTAVEVARMMATHHIHCLAVMGVTRSGAGESLAWGLVSDLNLVDAATGERPELTARTMADQAIISVEPDMPLQEAGRLMAANRASHVLVIDPETQHPVGVLSTLDIAGIVAWGEA
ncbi:MAG: cyclic nucleotide-binding/CBS domain-containing protein [Solirubrobacteraceae bacterium]